MSDLSAWSAQVRTLDEALRRLDASASRCDIPPCDDEPWAGVLRRKLRPQLDRDPVLVVAVVGGTNLGKSLLFNHLAGEAASASSPLAAGTKHPVCLVPPALADEAALAPLFPGFTLRPWADAADALAPSDGDPLFWRASSVIPPRLLLLDTPDVDSDAQVNWRRADAIRQSADVLVAVLTQQKYNDAAVKQFFRRAAGEGKTILVVFNQVDLDEDRPWWPRWLHTFASEIHAAPDLVYVVPRDREAARELRLPFYAVGPDGTGDLAAPGSLRDDLARLRFDAIKIRSFRGAIESLAAPDAIPARLARLHATSDAFARAARELSGDRLARVTDWPRLPPALLAQEIQTWWDARRAPWARRIHGAYRTLGNWVLAPVRLVQDRLGREPRDTALDLREAERTAVLRIVADLLASLERLAAVGNVVLQPRLERLLAGRSRDDLLNRVAAAHAALPAVDDDYRAFLAAELERLTRDHAQAYWALQRTDELLALARPAVTVTLAFTGFVFAGDLLGQAAAQAAGHTAGHLAAEAVVATAQTAGGEAAIHAAGHGLQRAAAAAFSRLQQRHAQQRADWLSSWLERELLGDLLADLDRGARLASSADAQAVRAALDALLASVRRPLA